MTRHTTTLGEQQAEAAKLANLLARRSGSEGRKELGYGG